MRHETVVAVELAALDEVEGMRCVLGLFEGVVSGAADGYARMNGLGLAVVTYCVGGLNMLNSIAGAYAEKSPVIAPRAAPRYRNRR